MNVQTNGKINIKEKARGQRIDMLIRNKRYTWPD